MTSADQGRAVIVQPVSQPAAIAPSEPAALLAALEPDVSGQSALAVNQYLAGLAPSSRRPMRHALETIAALLTDGRCEALTLPWRRLRAAHTRVARALLMEARREDGQRRFAPATVNRSLAALRGVLTECWRLDLIDEAAYKRAIDLKPDPGRRLPKGRPAPVDELTTLLQLCHDDRRPAGARDAALLMVLYGCGLRRAEAAALTLADYESATETLTVRHGKGDRARLAHLPPAARRWLERWLVVRGRRPGALFCPIDRHGVIHHARALSGQAIYAALARRVAAAGLDRLSPHDLRRGFITNLLEAGVDTIMAQSLAGHASPATTARYDRRGEAARRRAAHQLPAPTLRRERAGSEQ